MITVSIIGLLSKLLDSNIMQLAIYLFEQIYSGLWKINTFLLETTAVAHKRQRDGGDVNLASHFE